jgi:hypothetical protein
MADNVIVYTQDSNGNLVRMQSFAQLAGRSTDVKPAPASVGAGATYFEVDTGAQFVSDNVSWLRVPTDAALSAQMVSMLQALVSIDQSLKSILLHLQATLGH